MQYRTIGKNGEKLSILGYGCMRFPMKAGRIDKEKALAQITYAIDQGVNYLDTAYPYHAGESESFLGEYVLKNGYREKVNIATKLPIFLVRKEADMQKYFDKQIQRLQVETIDYYLLHALNGDSWDKMKSLNVVEFMDNLKKEGKIRKMGFSFHGQPEDFTRLIDEYDWDFCQIQLNILDENYQAGIKGLEYASEKNVGVMIMEPLRGGQLADQIPPQVQDIWDSSNRDYTPAEWALRWLWNNPNVAVVLSGMNQDEHIEENIRVASEVTPNHLTKDDLAVIERAKLKYQELLEINCTACRYCIDCPANINIPYAFQSYNNFKMFSKLMALGMYAMVVGLSDDQPKWTTTCIDCGKCEGHCPQFIEIRKEFKKVQKTVEHPVIRGITKLVRPFLRKSKT